MTMPAPVRVGAISVPLPVEGQELAPTIPNEQVPEKRRSTRRNLTVAPQVEQPTVAIANAETSQKPQKPARKTKSKGKGGVKKRSGSNTG